MSGKSRTAQMRFECPLAPAQDHLAYRVLEQPKLGDDVSEFVPDGVFLRVVELILSRVVQVVVAARTLLEELERDVVGDAEGDFFLRPVS